MIKTYIKSWADVLQLLPLLTSISLMIAYGVWFEPAKFLYWTGAAILTVGIIMMK